MNSSVKKNATDEFSFHFICLTAVVELFLHQISNTGCLRGLRSIPHQKG